MQIYTCGYNPCVKNILFTELAWPPKPSQGLYWGITCMFYITSLFSMDLHGIPTQVGKKPLLTSAQARALHSAGLDFSLSKFLLFKFMFASYKSHVSKHVCGNDVFISTAHNMLTWQKAKLAFEGLGQRPLFHILSVLHLHRSTADLNSGSVCSTCSVLKDVEQTFQ